MNMVSFPVRTPPARHRSKLVEMWGGLRACAHTRYRLANLMAKPLPDFMAGFFMSRLYRAAGFAGIERGAFISSPLRLTGTGRIEDNLFIADGATVSTDVTINLDAAVTLGRHATVSPYVRIYTASHRHGPSEHRCMPEVRARPVVIEEGCWIGLGALITPGVVVGRGSVVSAGAVLSRSVPPDSFVSGNPAAVVGKLQDGPDWMGPRPVRGADGKLVRRGAQ
ncbi:MAG: acyltransferase [Acidimicrobiales bacterium]|nr:acyltransferase [Acidimicrobiales bacterium]